MKREELPPLEHREGWGNRGSGGHAWRQSPGVREGWFTLHPTPGDRYHSLSVVSCVLLDEFLLLVRNVFERVNRVRRAGWDTGTTVDAALGIDVHLGGRLVAGLVLLGMDAVCWANLNTEGVFDAVISNYISHVDQFS